MFAVRDLNRIRRCFPKFDNYAIVCSIFPYILIGYFIGQSFTKEHKRSRWLKCLSAISEHRTGQQFVIKYSRLTRLKMENTVEFDTVCLIVVKNSILNGIKIRRIFGNPGEICRTRRGKSSGKIGTTIRSRRVCRSEFVVSTRLTPAGFPKMRPKSDNVEKLGFKVVSNNEVSSGT